MICVLIIVIFMCLGGLPAYTCVNCVCVRGGGDWLLWRPKEDGRFLGTGVIDAVVRVRVPILPVRKLKFGVLSLQSFS